MDIDEAQPPACFLIVYNVSKKHNIGTLARSAAAFGVKEVFTGHLSRDGQIDDRGGVVAS